MKWVRSFGVLMMGGLLLGATGQTPVKQAPVKKAAPAADFDRVAKEASTAREQNRVDDALQLYKQAVKLKPGWNEGWWWLGALQYDLDRYPEARDAFRKFIALDPKGGPAFAFLGLCEFQTKEYDKAIADLEHARELGLGDNPQLQNVALYHDAILLTKYEQFEPAGKVLLELARKMNCNPSVIEASGLAALRKPILPSEIKPDDRDVIAKTGRALCLAADRHGVEAQPLFEALVKEYPKEPNVHYIYGSFLLSTDPDAALAEFNKELELDPKHLPTLVSIVFEYLKRGEPDKAIPYARKSVQYGPNSFATHASLGKALADSGDLEGGIKELEIAVGMAPDSPQTRIALASAYAKVGRKEDAAKERAEFLKLKKKMSDPTAPEAK